MLSDHGTFTAKAIAAIRPSPAEKSSDASLVWDPIGLGSSAAVVTELLYHKVSMEKMTSGALEPMVKVRSCA